MSETSKQLKLVDISYQETEPEVATKSATKSEDPVANSDSANSATGSANSSSPVATSSAGTATGSGDLIAPTASP